MLMYAKLVCTKPTERKTPVKDKRVFALLGGDILCGRHKRGRYGGGGKIGEMRGRTERERERE